MEAIVATAHMLGLKAAVHAYSPIAIKQAVRAGVDSIEHGFLLDDEGIAMMKKAGTFLVPTLSASYPPPIFRIPNPESVQLRNEYKAFERAYAAGVKIAFGTDAGTFTHGDNAKEFELMVKFGMPPMDAIRCGDRHDGGPLRHLAPTPGRSRPASSPTSSRSRAVRSTTSRCCARSTSS